MFREENGYVLNDSEIKLVKDKMIDKGRSSIANVINRVSTEFTLLNIGVTLFEVGTSKPNVRVTVRDLVSYLYKCRLFPSNGDWHEENIATIDSRIGAQIILFRSEKTVRGLFVSKGEFIDDDLSTETSMIDTLVNGYCRHMDRSKDLKLKISKPEYLMTARYRTNEGVSDYSVFYFSGKNIEQ